MTTPRFTVLGSSGRIGSALVIHLGALGIPCETPSRDARLDSDPGHVVYAIGLTADFRQRPIETMDAHVARLTATLDGANYESFTYLSSTRVYRGSQVGAEDAALRVDPNDPDDVYTLSKLAGESVLHAVAGERARVIRLSNVLGLPGESDDFVPSIVRDAVRDGRIVLETSTDSSKDYVSIHDVVELIVRTATDGHHTAYNVASGEPLTNGAICDRIRDLTGCTVEVRPDAPTVTFPVNSIDRLREGFGFQPRSPLDEIDNLVEAARGKAST
jgi:nucleoside-diphosphate-sugar epimerase